MGARGGKGCLCCSLSAWYRHLAGLTDDGGRGRGVLSHHITVHLRSLHAALLTLDAHFMLGLKVWECGVSSFSPGAMVLLEGPLDTALPHTAPVMSFA